MARRNLPCVVLTVFLALLSAGCTTRVGGAKNKYTIIEYNGNYSCLVPNDDETVRLFEAALDTTIETSNPAKGSGVDITPLLDKYIEIKKLELKKHAMYRACEIVRNADIADEKKIRCLHKVFHCIVDAIEEKGDSACKPDSNADLFGASCY